MKDTRGTLALSLSCLYSIAESLQFSATCGFVAHTNAHADTDALDYALAPAVR